MLNGTERNHWILKESLVIAVEPNPNHGACAKRAMCKRARKSRIEPLSYNAVTRKEENDYMKNELFEQMNILKNAKLPCLAIETIEVTDLMNSLVQWAYLQQNNGRPIPVWEFRTDGIRGHNYTEWALCNTVPHEGGTVLEKRTSEIPTNSSSQLIASNDYFVRGDDGVLSKAQNRHGTDEQMMGDPTEEWSDYAIEFMYRFREILGEDASELDSPEPVVFVLREWGELMNNKGVAFVDRQRKLLEDVVDLGSELYMGQKIQPLIVLHTSATWSGRSDGGHLLIPRSLKDRVKIYKHQLPDNNQRAERIKEILAGTLKLNQKNYAKSYATWEKSGSEDSFEDWAAKSRATRSSWDGTKTDEEISRLSTALGGLTGVKIEDLLYSSMTSLNDLDLNYMINAKKSDLADIGLTVIDALEGDIDDHVGGLQRLKDEFKMLSCRFNKKAAEEFGLERPFPKGAMLLGPPGCGKSLVTKTVGNIFGLSIVRLDATNIKGKFVGESEAKATQILDILERMAPIILVVDEAEKLFGQGQESHDGGAHSAVLGQFLTFMQESNAGVYFMFTVNDASRLPPEMRARFDLILFLDLPERDARGEIWDIEFVKNKQDISLFDKERLIDETYEYSGRDIRFVMERAMTMALSGWSQEQGKISFTGQRPLTMDDFNVVFSNYVPTSQSDKESIELLRMDADEGLVMTANTSSIRDEKKITRKVTSNKSGGFVASRFGDDEEDSLDLDEELGEE